MVDQQKPPPAAPLDRTRRFVEGADGTLALNIQGRGTPVLLLHPLALAGRLWGEFAERLAQRFQVISMDVRGHGESTWSGAPFTMGDLARDVETVLDDLDLETVDLAGMSMGGSIAMTFAGMFPARVDHLLLADTTAWYGENAEKVWSERAERVLNLPRAEQVPFQTERWFTDGFRADHEDEVRRVVDIFLATDSHVHAAASQAMGVLDARELLDRIDAPTLVLTGAEDYATPPTMGQAAADGVQRGHSITLPRLRHLSLVERPELADVVAAHFEGRTEEGCRMATRGDSKIDRPEAVEDSP